MSSRAPAPPEVEFHLLDLPAMPWWTTAWTVERWRVKQGWNAITKAKPGDRLRRWLSLITRILWPIGGAVISAFVATLIQSAEDTYDEQLSLYLLAMITLFAFLILMLSAIKFAYQTFFSAPDLSMLQSLPLAPRGIFVAKYLDNLTFSNQLVAIFALGPWLGFGIAYNWTWSMFLIATLGLFFLPVFTTAFGIAISLVVSRLVPKSRMRETLMLGSMGASIYCYMVLRSAIFVDLENNVDPGIYLWNWAPSTWLFNALTGFGEAAASTYLLQYIFFGATLFILTAWLGDSAYHWGITHHEKDGARSGEDDSPWLLRMRGNAPSPARGIWYKDVLTFTRDPRQWYYLIFFAILFFMPVNPGEEASGSSGLAVLLMQTVSNAFILVIMATMALQELTVLGVSREGPRRWMVQSLPFTPMGFLLGKFSVVFVFTVILATLGAVAEVLMGQLEWSEFYPTLIGAIIISACINWAFLSLGARWPDFEGYHQRQRVSPLLAFAIAAVDGVVIAIFLFSATLLAYYEAFATKYTFLQFVSYESILAIAVLTMLLTLIGLIAGGLWNGYAATKRLLQESHI